jgi:hypothetical protein
MCDADDDPMIPAELCWIANSVELDELAKYWLGRMRDQKYLWGGPAREPQHGGVIKEPPPDDRLEQLAALGLAQRTIARHAYAQSARHDEWKYMITAAGRAWLDTCALVISDKADG